MKLRTLISGSVMPQILNFISRNVKFLKFTESGVVRINGYTSF